MNGHIDAQNRGYRKDRFQISRSSHINILWCRSERSGVGKKITLLTRSHIGTLKDSRFPGRYFRKPSRVWKVMASQSLKNSILIESRSQQPILRPKRCTTFVTRACDRGDWSFFNYRRWSSELVKLYVAKVKTKDTFTRRRRRLTALAAKFTQ